MCFWFVFEKCGGTCINYDDYTNANQETQCTEDDISCQDSVEPPPICPLPTPPSTTARPDLSTVCNEVSKAPDRYLVPHPSDCSKFVSCQWLGGMKYKPNVMSCPPTTLFDGGLMICNFGMCEYRKRRNLNLLPSSGSSPSSWSRSAVRSRVKSRVKSKIISKIRYLGRKRT